MFDHPTSSRLPKGAPPPKSGIGLATPPVTKVTAFDGAFNAANGIGVELKF